MFKASIVEEASENCGQKVTAACCDDSSKNPKEACRRRPFGLGGPRGVLKQQTGTRSPALAVIDAETWMWEELGKVGLSV